MATLPARLPLPKQIPIKPKVSRYQRGTTGGQVTTNAAKYGAFSTPVGHIKISWVIKKNEIALSWQERGGLSVLGPPAKEGFGSLLARHSIEGQLHGDLAFIWDADGLTANLSATVERLAL